MVVLLVVIIIVLSVLSLVIINSYLLTKEQREYQRYTKVGFINKWSVLTSTEYQLYHERFSVSATFICLEILWKKC